MRSLKDETNAKFNEALVLHQHGKFQLASALYGEILVEQPLHADARHLLGAIFTQTSEYQKAFQFILTAICICPDRAVYYCNRGHAYQLLKQIDEAIVHYRRALILDKFCAEAYSGLGAALVETSQPAVAIAPLCLGIALKPENAEAHFNLANGYRELGDLNQALLNFDRAIRLKSNYPKAYWNKSLTLLLGGNLAEGLPLFEWRWNCPETGLVRPGFLKPLWLGKESLAGKTILIQAEQGFGDTIQFCRYIQMVADLGARTIFEVPPALVELFRPLGGVSELVAKGSPLPYFDYYCPLLSMPLAFATDVHSIPSKEKYLSTDGRKVEYWASRLGEKTVPRVGLVWSSNSTFSRDATRSVRLAAILDSIPVGRFDIVCLQQEITNTDLRALESRPDIRFFGRELRNFSDTAALIESMDVVISTCTSVPHLAGAIGKRTWLLLACVPDWRWFLGRSDTPWYSCVRLYRQDKPGIWDSVFARIRADLLKLISE